MSTKQYTGIDYGRGIITEAEANVLREKNRRFEAWVDTERNRRNGWASYKPEDVPDDLRDFGNDERAKLEHYDFVNDRPQRYFAYYRDNASVSTAIVNFTGIALGTVVSASAIWRSNFGDRRRAVTVKAINGITYKGIAQMDNGDYVRLRAIKAKR